jgi:cytochrome c peroxidase
MGRLRNIGLIVLLILALLAGCKPDENGLSQIPYNPSPYDLKIPAGFPQMSIPADNPMTTEGVALGRFLFYDKSLSGNGTMSCASCHLPALNFADGQATSKGIDGIAGKRSSMSLENIGFFNKGLFWDGRVKTLEEQALLPVEDPIELHNSWDKVVEKLRNHADYPSRFRKTFGITDISQITKDLTVKAIAQFERSLISGNSKFDKVFRREGGVEFTDAEYDGYLLFFNAAGAPDAQCGHCHATPFFNANEFFNNGLDSAATLTEFKDKGRGLVTGRAFDNGKFRAVSLRNIELTAPYMHDGRFKTLEEVMAHYASGGHYADNVDPFIPQIKQIKLTDRQKRNIILFMKTLTDTSFIQNPNFQDPFK